MGTVLLVRHGETPWNRERRLQGWAPVGLSAVGQQQASRLGARIVETYEVDRIEASDLRRVEETVRWLRRGGRLEVPITYVPAWRERDFGIYQGLSYPAFFHGYPAYSLEAVGTHAVTEETPGGETLLEMYERVIEGWERLRAELEPGETVLVVSHGGPIRAVLGAVKGIDIVEAMTAGEQDNCHINEIAVRDGTSVITRENGAEVEHGVPSG